MTISTDSINDNEKSLIMGTLLGDAPLQKRGENSCRLAITHSVEQKALTEWKYSKLLRFCGTTKGPTERIEKKGRTIRFETSSSSILLPLHSLFYKRRGEHSSGTPKYVKEVTKELIGELPMNPIVLAVFFMDDGSVRNDCNAGKIAIQGFSLQENLLLCKYIHKWGVKAHPTLHTAESGQYYICGHASGNFLKIRVNY